MKVISTFWLSVIDCIKHWQSFQDLWLYVKSFSFIGQQCSSALSSSVNICKSTSKTFICSFPFFLFDCIFSKYLANIVGYQCAYGFIGHLCLGHLQEICFNYWLKVIEKKNKVDVSYLNTNSTELHIKYQRVFLNISVCLQIKPTRRKCVNYWDLEVLVRARLSFFFFLPLLAVLYALYALEL